MEQSVVRDEVPLAPYTTLEMGGPARALVEATTAADVSEALAWADRERLLATALGAGSNVVVADCGIPGLVVRVALRGTEVSAAPDGSSVLVTAAAGERWDDLVAMAVAEGWGGIECLSGIPGTVGATPIQNVGAYGQEVAATIVSVRVLDRTTRVISEMSAAECSFAYRDSVFRRDPARWIVLAVTFRLAPGAPGLVRYEELARALGARGVPPPPSEVRAAVLELRRGKSMVLDPGDPNRRSVGSFFVNPVVAQSAADEVVHRALASGVVKDAGEVPRHRTDDGRVKLSAAWLVERSGFPKGTRRGAVGISTRHSLALVNNGGGTAAELVALARQVRSAVLDRFNVALRPEPIFLGFPDGDPVSAP